MAPTLPSELLSHILALENAGQPPVERQLNRQRFERVCKDWFRAVDRWSEIAVVGSLALRDLRDELRDDVHFEDSGGVVGPRVRALHVELRARTASNAWQTALGAVFEHIPNLDALSIKAESGLGKTFGTALGPKFTLVPRLRKFALEGINVFEQALAV